MRKNLYVTCGDLKKYDGWEVIQVIPRAVNNADYCMAIITKDDSDNKATDENWYKAMYEDYKSRFIKAIEYNNQIIKDTKDFYRPTTDIIYSGDTLIEIATNNINILKNGSENK